MTELAMFPLGTVLLPTVALPLHVFEPRYLALTDDVRSGDGQLGIVLIARGHEVGGGDERFGVGCMATVEHHEQLADGRRMLVVRGRQRLRVIRWLAEHPYPRAEIEELGDPRPSEAEAAAYRAAAHAGLQPLDLQAVLELDDPRQRVEAVQRLLDDRRQLLDSLRSVDPPA